jgi:hypothetical protein
VHQAAPRVTDHGALAEKGKTFKKKNSTKPEMEKSRSIHHKAP